jgi:hypothetical protein
VEFASGMTPGPWSPHTMPHVLIAVSNRCNHRKPWLRLTCLSIAVHSPEDPPAPSHHDMGIRIRSMSSISCRRSRMKKNDSCAATFRVRQHLHAFALQVGVPLSRVGTSNRGASGRRGSTDVPASCGWTRIPAPPPSRIQPILQLGAGASMSKKPVPTGRLGHAHERSRIRPRTAPRG